jgi:hypothetical protein
MAKGKFGDPCIERHTIHVYDRGGMTRLATFVDVSQVSWGRDRDGISEASLTIEGTACEENRNTVIKKIASKRHEIVIFRGGQRVWEGVIFRISDEGWRIKVFAKDVICYLFGTMLSRAWDNRHNSVAGVTTVTGRFEEIITWELTHSHSARKVGGGTITVPGWEQLDPPANILPYLEVHHFPNEAETSAYTAPFETSVGLSLAGAARSSGIDFTAVGRAIHLWDVSRSIGGPIQTLTEADFYGNVIVTEYGADHTQGAYVMGQDGNYGEAVNPEKFDFYGPWMTPYTAYSEEGAEEATQGELNSQASRNTSGRSPVPFEVRIPDGSTLRLSDKLSLDDLVPGVQIPLLATLNARKFNQMQKLDHLVVTEKSDGEEVKVTLTPATKPDSDIEEEDD